MDQLVKAKYQGEVRERKNDTLLKLSFDTAFYLTVTSYFIVEFRREYWFPQWVGG